MKEVRIRWNASEEAALIDKTAENMVARKIELKWDQERLFGLRELVEEAQKQVLPSNRRRTLTGQVVMYLREPVHKRLMELRGDALPAAAPASEAAPAPVPQLPPFIPNRLGLDPKFAESLVYVFQVCARAIGEELGAAIGDKVRAAVYDIKFHLGTPKGYAPFDPAATQPMPVAAPEEKPAEVEERLRKHKICVLTLHNDQRQIIMRQFPNIDFRFVDRGNAKAISVCSAACEQTFIMTKFIAHKDEQCVQGHIRRVNGGITELARSIMVAYPDTLYKGLQQVQSA